MKTKEEILEHLEKVGYDDFATAKILGYLLGANIAKKGEEIIFHQGKYDFEYFFKWLNEKPQENKFFDIATNLDYLLGFGVASKNMPESVANKTRENIQFLMENKEFLQDCMKKKAEAEAFQNDVEEVMEGINKTLESLLKR